MVQLLRPMGFELRVVAGGHDCLDLPVAGYRPNVIFMDLAMPGFDGWETLRRIKGRGYTDIHLVIVSANAFDKGLSNYIGIRPEDFIVKPYRHTKLIDWLEKRPALSRIDVPAAEVQAQAQALPIATARVRVWPDAPQLAAPLELVTLGFYRGIMNKLADMEKQQPATTGFVEEIRVQARKFQFEAMGCQLVDQETGHVRNA